MRVTQTTLLAWTLLVGCGQDHKPAPRRDERPVTKPVVSRTAAHDAPIQQIAVVETGDAALTVDQLGGMRFWPTLDGTKEPVIVRAQEPRAIELSRTTKGFLAAILDAAGGLELIVLGPDGSVRDRATTGGEPGIVEIRAIPDGLLALRRDHSLARFGGDGKPRGTLVPEPGIQLATLFGRGDQIYAGIAAPAEVGEPAPDLPLVSAIRRIVLGEPMSWDKRIDLPAPATTVALSPNGKRLAMVVEEGVLLHELGARAPSLLPVRASDEGELGFVDDDHVLLPGMRLVDWNTVSAADPWDEMKPFLETSVVAFGGGLAAGAADGGLLVARVTSRPRWLGYAASGVPTDLHLRCKTCFAAINVSLDQFVWLDPELHAQRIFAKEPDPASSVFVVDERHVLECAAERHAAVRIRDLETNAIVDLGSDYERIFDVVYDPATRVLALLTDSTTHRLRVDFAHGTYQAMRPLATAVNTHLVLLPPATGLAAIATSANDFVGEAAISDGEVVRTFREEPGTKELEPSSKIKVPGHVIGIDDRGWVYVVGDEVILAYDRGKQVARLDRTEFFPDGAVSHDGATIVLLDGQTIMAIDATGKQRWREVSWRATGASFSPDDKLVIITTESGVVELDAKTGKKIFAVCAWGFGLHAEKPKQGGATGSLSVCSEER